jgi:hypothetical protein
MSTKTLVKAGKLYICEEYFLMLYPDKETAEAIDLGAVTLGPPLAGEDHGSIAAYWSKRFGKHVGSIEKNIPLLVLDMKQDYVHVLAAEQKGWIIFQYWLNLKEIG